MLLPAMLPRLLLAAAIAGLAGPASSSLLAGHTPNKFIVTYTGLPSFEKFGFYSMPRNVGEAKSMDFAVAADRLYDDGVTVWCRKGDFRVCVLMDREGSAAGIQIAFKASEQEASRAPIKIDNTPEWRRHKLLGEDVYSTTVFFVSKEVLAAGGRRDLWAAEGLTTPDGLYLQQSDGVGRETGRLHVPAAEAGAEAAGFTEQGCFVGMGKHFHQGLSNTSKCENHRPYFTLYDKSTSKLIGFGIGWYAKPSNGDRHWFESPIPLMSKVIFPHAPSCFFDWIKEYGKFSLHVYFVEHPWLIDC